MIRSLARSRRTLVSFAVVVSSNLAGTTLGFARNGAVRPVADGTVEATFVVNTLSGQNDRVITRYGVHAPGQPNGLFVSEFDPNSVICGARTFQGQSDPNTAVTSASFLDLRPEDPMNAGHPDLTNMMSPPVFFADENNGGIVPRPCPSGVGYVDWTFGLGMGISNMNLQGFFLTYRFFPPGQDANDQCAIGIDTDSGVTGRCQVFDSRALPAPGVFRDLGSDAFLEVKVFERRLVDMSIRFHGSSRFPGDLGSPIVVLRTRGTRSILPTTDKPSTTVKVDNTTPPPLTNISVQLTIQGDLTGLTPGGNLRDFSHLFRTSDGQPIGPPRSFPINTGQRLIVQAAVPGVPDRFIALTPVNIPMFASMTATFGAQMPDREVGVLGLRPNPGTHDDNQTDAFVRPRAATRTGDALAVRFRAYDFWNSGAFRISGIEVVGHQLGGNGLDALEVRKQDAILTDSPDLSPNGRLGFVGTLDGIAELPLAAGVANRFNIVTDISFPFPPGIQDDIWLIAYFPQETAAGVEIGSDRTFATLLGDSFFTLQNAQPFVKSPQDNFQLRLLLDGEFGTIAPTPAPAATLDPPSLEADHLRLVVGDAAAR
ncbi:MAG: hypothetical protein HYR85_11025 [Planctomycetes bacterium]|nr:hypothetical protein [Planctomycetota bacterium]MBI3845735.1 hypothetical protein [Planctomycetota bacterium]